MKAVCGFSHARGLKEGGVPYIVKRSWSYPQTFQKNCTSDFDSTVYPTFLWHVIFISCAEHQGSVQGCFRHTGKRCNCPPQVLLRCLPALPCIDLAGYHTRKFTQSRMLSIHLYRNRLQYSYEALFDHLVFCVVTNIRMINHIIIIFVHYES